MQTSHSSKQPLLIISIFPPPLSSAGVPNKTTLALSPYSEMTDFKANKTKKLLIILTWTDREEDWCSDGC